MVEYVAKMNEQLWLAGSTILFPEREKGGGVSFFIQQKRLQKNDNLMKNFQITYLIHM